MEITKQSRHQLRLQNIIFIILFCAIIGLLAWITNKYRFESDWTGNNRNTLSEVSIKLLEKIPAPVKITTFIPDGNLVANSKYIKELVAMYQKHKSDISLEIINPDTHPDLVRKLKVTNYGEVVVEYEGRSEHISQLKEETLTNTLQRLLRQGDRKVLFITGHGERTPDGRANFDWGSFTEKLNIKGIHSETLALYETAKIPDAAAIIIASPQANFLPGEVTLILDYVKNGGNLLWINDPGKSLYGLDPLAEYLGINFFPGTIVDPTAQMMNVKDPTFSIITSYPEHTITRDFQYISIFPRAVAINHSKDDANWFALPFLQTVPRSWSETGVLEGAIDYNADKDIVGPLTIGLSLTRKDVEDKLNSKLKKQRIVILGDGDFLSNTYLGNQGNLNLGHNILNWISNDDDFITIPSSTAVDTQLNISDLMGAIIGLFFLVALPLALLVAGGWIWYKRRTA